MNPLELLTQVQAASALVGLALLLLLEGFLPVADHFCGARRARRAHIGRNLALGLLNAATIAVAFAGLWVLTAAWADAHGFGLLHVLRDHVGLPGWAHAVGAVLLLDGWTYAWHRINHRISFLWRFHRVHHADAEMDVTTASRFHVGELVLSSALRVPLLALGGIYAWELVIYETVMFAVVQFHHANLAVPARADRALRALIVTPSLHRVHHSRWQPETDSNYGALLSVWDRVFGSFRTRERPEEIRLGLDAFDGPEHQTIRGMLRMPLSAERRSDADDRSEVGPAASNATTKDRA